MDLIRRPVSQRDWTSLLQAFKVALHTDSKTHGYFQYVWFIRLLLRLRLSRATLGIETETDSGSTVPVLIKHRHSSPRCLNSKEPSLTLLPIHVLRFRLPDVTICCISFELKLCFVSVLKTKQLICQSIAWEPRRCKLSHDTEGLGRRPSRSGVFTGPHGPERKSHQHLWWCIAGGVRDL